MVQTLMALSRGKGSTGPACVAGFLCSHFVGILTSLAPDEWAGPKAWTDLPGGLEKAWKSVDCCGCSFGCWGGRSWSDLAGAGGCGSLSGGGGGGLGKAREGLSPVSPRGDLALPSWYRLSFLCFLESPPPPGFSVSEVLGLRGRAEPSGDTTRAGGNLAPPTPSCHSCVC